MPDKRKSKGASKESKPAESKPIEQTIVVEGGAYKVVKGQIPANLLKDLGRDFTAAEKAAIFARIHKSIAPSNEKPIVLWVFGPSAVGKSFLSNAKASVLFGNLQNAVLVDGAEFREVHAGFQAVALHGMQNNVLHAEAWDILKGTGKVGDGFGICGQLKRQIMDEAMRDRQHLIIPDCANRMDRLLEMIDAVAEAGYEMHAICLWAPLNETRKRGEPRSVREGKKWSARGYDDATKGTLALAKRWVCAATSPPSPLLYYPRVLPAFARLLKLCTIAREALPIHPGTSAANAKTCIPLLTLTFPSAAQVEGQKKDPTRWASLSMWDNSAFPSVEITLAQLEKLTNLSHAEADAHAAACRRKAEITSPSAIAARKMRITSGVHKFIGTIQKRADARATAHEAVDQAGLADDAFEQELAEQCGLARRQGRLEGMLLGASAVALAAAAATLVVRISVSR
eukprot:6181195-Pleurochrysis_carterae.AAC.2